MGSEEAAHNKLIILLEGQKDGIRYAAKHGRTDFVYDGP